MPHADEGRLHAYLDGALHAESPAEARALERHLERCDDCRSLLEFERAVRHEAAELLAGVTPGAAAAPPPWGEILHRAGRAQGANAGGGARGDDRAGARRDDGDGASASGGGRRMGYAWLPAGRRLAWAASVVVALGVGWWAHAALGVGPFGGPTASRADSEAATAGRLAPSGEPEPSAPAASLQDAAGGEADEREAPGTLGEEVAEEAGSPGGAEDGRDAGRRQDSTGNAGASGAPTLDELRTTAFRDAREGAADAGESSREGEAAPLDDAAPASPAALGRAEARAADEAPAPAAAAVPADVIGKAEPESAPVDPILVPDRQGPVPEAAAAARLAAPEAFARDDEAPPWTAVGLVEARALLGTAPVGVPGADVLEIAWGAGGRTLRVTQRLPTGERIDLYQWQADRQGTAGPVFGDDPGDPAAQRERDRVAGPRSRPPLSMVSLDGLLVAGSGLVEPSVLRELLQGLEALD